MQLHFDSVLAERRAGRGGTRRGKAERRGATALRTVWLLLAAVWVLGGTAAWGRWDEKFTVRRKITIDTSEKGQPIPGLIGGATVLIRLHDGNFAFENAKEDGSDLRFLAADEKTLLPFHLEKFDSLLHEGLAWVKVPEVAANGQTQLWLYYGNPAAERAGDPKASFDGETVLAYHFAEPNTAPVDSTAGGHHAQGTAPTVGALIGNGIRLGTPAPVTLPEGALPWTEGGTMTWSAWVKITGTEPNAYLFRRREGNRSFGVGADAGVPFLAIDAQQAKAGAALPPGTWHHLAVVAEAGTVALYVDGENAASLSTPLPALRGPALLGGDSAAGETSVQGELDELEIARTARSAGWVKLAAIGQAGEKAAKLLSFGEEDAGSGNILGNGHFAIIIRNLTFDGWVVIILLAIMGTVTLTVVVRKWRYLGRIGAGNRHFLTEWQRLRGDLSALEDNPQSFGETLAGPARKALARSPLYAIYKIGMQEVAHRMAMRRDQPKSLTSRGLQAIRAELDTGLMLESERLNSGIVLLTIAISGGPFLGLLGTVVGVMITFAAVAAAGEVNVNAIAPGIAAALLATVAGLAVAIPALFAYNYLLTRIKSATRDLNVFIESFITKLAEQYRGGPAE